MTVNHPVTAQMQSLVERWEAAHDDRALFLRCYALMTQNTLAAIQRDEFNDPEWVGRLLHRFADYYFAAERAYAHDPASAPRVWQLAHAAAADPELAALRKLLLGVSAHINYDLVLTLVDVLQPEWAGLAEAQRAGRYADHRRINAIIGRTIDAVQDQVLEPAAPALEIIDALLGPVDELLISQLLARWRETVWHNAARLLALEEAAARIALIAAIEQNALDLGAVIHGGARPRRP
ncbi:MAG: hypothetical protein KA764_10185 [Anaerolineales bacterium]|nr:hypothetical protein [Anaerolineales bacterium]